MQQNNQNKYITNPYPQYETDNRESIENLKARIPVILEKLVTNLEENIELQNPLSISSLKGEKKQGFDLYQGPGGNLYFYLKLFEFLQYNNEKKQLGVKLSFDDPDLALKKAQIVYDSLINVLQKSRDREVTYMMGGVGIYTLGCRLFYYLNDVQQFNICVSKVIEIKKNILKNYHKIPFEILYGVPGYLFCLLELQKQFQFNDTLRGEQFRLNLESHVQDISELILDQGIQDYQNNQRNLAIKMPRLYYTMFDSEYLGPAHGVSGVVYLLIKGYQLNKNTIDKFDQSYRDKLFQGVTQSLAFLVACQTKDDGNIPASTNSRRSDLVQFCHGAPGMIAVFIAAYELFNKQEYLDKAIEFGNLAWQKGLLKKGYGLCHGITGNAYFFLTLFKATKDQKWLYYAYIFANSYLNKDIQGHIDQYQHPQRQSVGKADTPFSLMEGMAGNLCFYMHCLYPEKSKFPCYEI